MQPLEPAILTIFGITGDLAQRKLLPALYHLAHQKHLPESFKIVGISRRGTKVSDVIEVIKDSVHASGKRCDEATITWLEQAISIVDMDITNPDDYAKLKTELDNIEESLGICQNRLFYLAIPASLFSSVIDRLGKKDLNTGCQHGVTESRLLIEKPFGYDLSSAKELITTLGKSFSEDHIYRIDHYLAKEVSQNILTLRFENPLFSTSWNKDHISHIVITSSETIGIEGRVAFYEQMGAFKDLIQSHLFQILALVTMDRPTKMEAPEIHKAKVAVMHKMLPPHENDMATQTARGQYQTYKEEVSSHHSMVETYAAVRVTIDDPKWQGVPMYIRTGKALSDKVIEMTVVFKDPAAPDCTNHLTIRIQPNEGIVLNLRIKKPGFEHVIQDVNMDYCYNQTADTAHPDAYERVLVDVMRGDKTLFATNDEVLASWQITEPIMQAWQANQVPLHIYPNGTFGPKEADDFLSEVQGTWPKSGPNICHIPEKSDTI